MQLIRSRLAAVALALLAWQITGVAATPVALVCLDRGRAASAMDAECTCDHTGTASCPMHKGGKKHTDVPQPHQARWCAGCDQADRMILTMLAASSGLPEIGPRAIRPAATSELMSPVGAVLPDTPRPSVSPPPKS